MLYSSFAPPPSPRARSSGFLFCASEFGNHGFYQFQGVGEDEDSPMCSSAALDECAPHAHARARICSRALSHAGTQARMHAHAQAHTRTHRHARARARVRTPRGQAHPRARAHPRGRARARAHAPGLLSRVDARQLPDL
eukprot:6206643-Pleurochrysis_carterae.AAC.1